MQKKYIIPLIICLLLSAGNSHPETIPADEMSPESISMSWKQFIDLWVSANEPKPERTTPFAYENAVYTGVASIDKDHYLLRFSAVIRIASFHDRRILVPVLSRKLSPEKMIMNGEPTGWMEKNGYYHIIVSGPGVHEIETEFTITLDARRWPRSFKLPLVPIPRSEIKLNITDADVDARFDPGVVLETVRGGSAEGDRIRGLVPAVKEMNIRWLKRGGKKERIPLKMGAAMYTYVSLGENGARLKSEVSFQILQGEGHYFRIQIPEGIDILDVTAVPDNTTDNGEQTGRISQWYAEDREKGHIIHIHAAYRQKENFRVRIDCERTETKSSYRFAVPRVVPLDVERYENLVAAGSQANVEVNESGVENSEGRDVRFLPDELRRFAGSRALFYYKTLKDDFRLEFEVKSHDKASVVKTRIARIDAHSVVTGAGTVMTKATLRVKNNQAQFLRLGLPADSKLLSAFTNGREIQPSLDGETFLIPVDKSTGTAFPVEIAWLAPINAFGIAGKNTISLPSSDLSIGELAWWVYTPESCQILFFRGNVEQTPQGWFLPVMRMLSSRASEFPRPAYAGREAFKTYDYNVKGLKKRFKTSPKTEGSRSGSAYRNTQVQVQIPVTGNPYRFESYLVKGFTPSITFFYVNGVLHQCITAACGFFAFFFVFWMLAFVLERKAFPAGCLRPGFVIMILLAAAVMITLLLVFKLGAFYRIWEGIAAGTAAFSLWQNRLEAGRICGTGRSSITIRFLTAALLLALIPAMISRFPAGMFLAGGASIFLHLFLFRLFNKLKKFRENKKTAASTAMLLLFIFTALWTAGVPVSWAGSPGRSCPGGADERPLSPQTDAEVHLTWETMETLLHRIEDRKKEEKNRLKAHYLFGAASIDGDITEKYASLVIEAPLTLVSDGFVRIPLVSADTPVATARYNGIPLALVRGRQHICFETDAKTPREGLLRLELIAPVREKSGVKEFEVDAPLFQGGSLVLRFGEDIKSVRLFNISWEKREGRVIRAALGPSRKIKGELATFFRKQENADEADRRVKKRYAATYTLVSLEDEIATVYSSIRYRILNDQAREFRIRLPETASVHEIVGEDMEGWKTEKSENGMTTYLVKVMYPVADRYDLSVRYETSVPGAPTPFVVPCLMVDGVARDAGYIGIEMRGGGEISIQTLKKARLIDIRELPPLIRADADAPFVYAFRYIERPYRLAFQVRGHKACALDPAIADRIQYTRVISPMGKMLSQARMWIRNSRKQYAAVSLPRGARIISAFLDGKSVKPSVDGNGGLLLPLKRQSATPFVLDMVFEDADLPLGFLGGIVELCYPQVDLPASIVAADVYLPRQMKAFAPEGDLQKIASVDFVPWSTGERISNVDVERQHQISGKGAGWGDMPQGRTAGTLSLKIKLPKHGRRTSLNTFYVPAGKALRTSLFVMHRYLYQGGYVLAVLLLLAVGGGFTVFYRRALFWGISVPIL